jgi:hypothetical protein
MTRMLAIMLGAGLLGDAALAQGQMTEHPQRGGTLQTLNQRIPELGFEDLPLEQVVQWLGEYTRLDISVRWQTLGDAGVDRDKPISIRARDLRLTQVLWLLMNEAGGSEVKLGYRASGNLLVLSTAADLDREMVTKIYDVSDLLIRLPRAGRQGAFDVTAGMGQQGTGANSGVLQAGKGSNGGNADNQNGEQAGEREMQELVKLIQETVEPDSWRVHEGMGTIVPYQRSIIVRNTIQVHQRLGGYLAEGDVVSK